MGRNKIQIKRIQNERIKQVTFYKRKKGLIKKSMELSVLCDVKVFLLVCDKNDKMSVFSSDNETSKFKENFNNIHKAKETYHLSDVNIS